LPAGVVGGCKGLQERVEVVRACGEVEPNRLVEVRLKGLVKLWHVGHGFRCVDERMFQEGDTVADFGDFNSVVYIYIFLHFYISHRAHAEEGSEVKY